jgi:hypothetical protein
MRIPEHKRYVIAQLLEQFLDGPASRNLVDIARTHCAVPIYSSWTSTVFLKTDGQFFTLDQETDQGKFSPELSEAWQIASLSTAARSNSLLSVLLPERTSAAVDCSFCEGMGFVRVGKERIDITCGECGGLGWCDSALDQKAT